MIISANPSPANTVNAPQKTNTPAFKGMFVKTIIEMGDGLSTGNLSYLPGKIIQDIQSAGADIDKTFRNLIQSPDPLIEKLNRKFVEKYDSNYFLNIYQRFANGISVAKSTASEIDSSGKIIYSAPIVEHIPGSKITSVINSPISNRKITQEVMYVPDEEVGKITNENAVSKFVEFWNKK